MLCPSQRGSRCRRGGTRWVTDGIWLRLVLFLAKAREVGELCKCIYLALLVYLSCGQGGGNIHFSFVFMYHQCHIKLQCGRGRAIGEILTAALPSSACQHDEKPVPTEGQRHSFPRPSTAVHAYPRRLSAALGWLCYEVCCSMCHRSGLLVLLSHGAMPIPWYRPATLMPGIKDTYISASG